MPILRCLGVSCSHDTRTLNFIELYSGFIDCSNTEYKIPRRGQRTTRRLRNSRARPRTLLSGFRGSSPHVSEHARETCALQVYTLYYCLSALGAQAVEDPLVVEKSTDVRSEPLCGVRHQPARPWRSVCQGTPDGANNTTTGMSQRSKPHAQREVAGTWAGRMPA